MFKVILKQGDMFNEKEADFVVNPSNTLLILGSGVSAAIRRVCGNELQKEMKKLAPIKQGEVVATKCPKNPNYKTILHAAIMDYTNGAIPPTLDTIKTALNNIYKFLTPNSKLLLPLMGTGVGGLDKKEVIKIYKDFFSKPVKDNYEIVIFGYSEDDFKLLREIFNQPSQ